MNTTQPTSTETVIGTVKLGTTTYTVSHIVCTWDDAGETKTGHDVTLTGPRGSRFLVRPFLYRKGQQDMGVHQVINLKSGAELRSRGNLVRVVMVGDIIEAA